MPMLFEREIVEQRWSREERVRFWEEHRQFAKGAMVNAEKVLQDLRGGDDA